MKKIILSVFASVILLAALPGYAHSSISSSAILRDSVPAQVLVLGNSITYHGAKPSIGWSGNWGMAASAVEKDYIHILESRVKKANRGTAFKFGNIADSFERQFWKYDSNSFKDYSKLNADLIILEIGENINDTLAVKYGLDNCVEKFVHELSSHKNLKVCLVGSFWPNQHIDKLMKAVASRNNWLYVDLHDLYKDRNTNTVANQYANRGVGMHPSDAGMESIANRIWNKVEYLFINR